MVINLIVEKKRIERRKIEKKIRLTKVREKLRLQKLKQEDKRYSYSRSDYHKNKEKINKMRKLKRWMN